MASESQVRSEAVGLKHRVEGGFVHRLDNAQDREYEGSDRKDDQDDGRCSEDAQRTCVGVVDVILAQSFLLPERVLVVQLQFLEEEKTKLALVILAETFFAAEFLAQDRSLADEGCWTLAVRLQTRPHLWLG